jgi:nicotinamidase-related amidase
VNSHQIFPQEIVLLVIDLQDKLMKAMPERERVVKNTRIMLELARLYDIPVIVTEQYPQGLGRTVPEVSEGLEGHHLLEKITFSACGSELKNILKGLGRTKLVVAGCETHVCVYQTVRDLIALDYVVYVAEDAVCSRFTSNYNNGLELMRNTGGIITNTETVVFDILQQAGTAEFKAMSRMIK